MYNMQSMQNVQTWTPVVSRLLNWRVKNLIIINSRRQYFLIVVGKIKFCSETIWADKSREQYNMQNMQYVKYVKSTEICRICIFMQNMQNM